MEICKCIGFLRLFISDCVKWVKRSGLFKIQSHIRMYVCITFIVRKSQCEATGVVGGRREDKNKLAACSLATCGSKIPVAKSKKTMTAKDFDKIHQKNFNKLVSMKSCL